MAIPTDEEITGRVQAGDLDAFGFLIERYEARLLRYGRKFLADPDDIVDLVQDVFIKAYVNIQSFDVTRTFSPWIYRIAHNTFVNALKKKKNEPTYSFDLDAVFPNLIAKETADEVVNQRELSTMLEECLDMVGSKYKEPLVLYYFEEMSYSEIAEILHIPESTVGVRLRRGRMALKDAYDKLEGNNVS